jgi:hypothetical protein
MPGIRFAKDAGPPKSNDPFRWWLAVMRLGEAFRPCSFASLSFDRFAMSIL